MTNRITIAAFTVACVLAVAATAQATKTVPNIFGGPGSQPKLNPNCSRAEMFITPAGKTWSGTGHTGKKYVFAISTVMGAQIKCLIHRVDQKRSVPPPAKDECFAKAGPVPATAEDTADKRGYHDTKGLNALRAWANNLALCEAAR